MPSAQLNTAREHGTVFAVTGGDLRVHQYGQYGAAEGAASSSAGAAP